MAQYVITNLLNCHENLNKVISKNVLDYLHTSLRLFRSFLFLHHELLLNFLIECNRKRMKLEYNVILINKPLGILRLRFNDCTFVVI